MAQSALTPETSHFLRTVSSPEALLTTLRGLGLDPSRLTFAHITPAQLRRGYDILANAEMEVLQRGDDDEDSDGDGDDGASRAATRKVPARVRRMSDEFYALFPHEDGSLPPLSTHAQVRRALALLEVLRVVADTGRVLEARVVGMHPTDVQLARMRCGISPVPVGSPEFEDLATVVSQTLSPKHRATRLHAVVVEQAVAVQRAGERSRFSPWQPLANRRMLWHGVPLSSAVGVLAHGLRLPPPEAPATAYAFGKGIPFADLASTAALHCQATHAQPRGLLLLCEVACGREWAVAAPSFSTHAHTGTHCTVGVGHHWPSPRGDKPWPWRTGSGEELGTAPVAHFGPVIDVLDTTLAFDALDMERDGAATPPALREGRWVKPQQDSAGRGVATEGTFQHNHIIVHDVSQVCIRYALVVRLELAAGGRGTARTQQQGRRLRGTTAGGDDDDDDEADEPATKSVVSPEREAQQRRVRVRQVIDDDDDDDDDDEADEADEPAAKSAASPPHEAQQRRVRVRQVIDDDDNGGDDGGGNDNEDSDDKVTAAPVDLGTLSDDDEDGVLGHGEDEVG